VHGMMINRESRHGAMRRPQNGATRGRHGLVVAGGLLSALAASSCCVLPLVLFGLGVSGAWIGTFAGLAPYQPWFVAAAIGFLAGGIWLNHRSARVACVDGVSCERPGPGRLFKAGLVLATILTVAALALDLLAPVLL